MRTLRTAWALFSALRKIQQLDRAPAEAYASRIDMSHRNVVTCKLDVV